MSSQTDDNVVTTSRKSWPLLRRYGPDVAVLFGTAVFLTLVSVVGLLMIQSR